MPPILGLIPCWKQIFFLCIKMYLYIHISYDFLATEKKCFHHQSTLLLQKQSYFSLLKAKTKGNQVIMWLSKSTVNHDLFITYLKPLSPPDPWYLSLVKDIKDQLSCDCPERNGKHVHRLSLPRRRNAAFLCSPDSCSLRGFWANPTRTQFSHVWN